MKKFLAMLLLGQAGFSTTGFAADCFGKKSAPIGMVYLHGLDTETFLGEEKQAREILKRLAVKHDIRIALPRAKERCYNQAHGKKMLCWKADDPSELKKTLAAIKSETESCLAGTKKKFIYGFSNGGWFVNKMLRWCVQSSFDALVASGAGGSADKYSPKTWASCGRLTLIVGDKDRYNIQPTRKFLALAKERRADVNLLEFLGGHEVSQMALEDFLTKVFDGP